MSVYDLPKTYDFKDVEERLYAWWEAQGFFRPKEDLEKILGFPPGVKPFFHILEIIRLGQVINRHYAS